MHKILFFIFIFICILSKIIILIHMQIYYLVIFLRIFTLNDYNLIITIIIIIFKKGQNHSHKKHKKITYLLIYY